MSSILKLMWATALGRCAITVMLNSALKPDFDNSQLAVPLLQDELVTAEKVIAIQSQKFHYPELCLLLKDADSRLPERHMLHRLRLWKPDGVIQLHTRLANADICDDAKMPTLLFHRSPLAKLFIRSAHVDNCHAGPSIVITLFMLKYYIPKLRSLVRQICHNCRKCRRAYTRIVQPPMGDLPAA